MIVKCLLKYGLKVGINSAIANFCFSALFWEFLRIMSRYSYLLLPSISKRFLHKLTYVLRVKFVEKPNININFSQSIHNNSGVTAA